MKKIISMITCLIILTCMLVVPEPIEVHAEESDTESNRYYVEALTSYSSGSNLYRGYYVNFAFSIDKKICGYLDNSYDASIYLFLYDENGYTSLGTKVHNLKNSISYSLEPNGVYKYGDYEFNGGNFTFTGIISEKENTLHADLSWDSKNIEDSGFIKTNIPYFASQEECLAYINGEIDEKSAINYESDLTDIIYDLEVPQDMKLTCDDGMFSLPIYTMKWKQNDPNYQNWTTEVYVYVSMDAWEGALGIHLWGDSYTYEDMYLMGESFSTYKLKYVIDVDSDKYEKAEEAILDYIFNDNPKLSGSAVDYYKVYMRNYYNDGTYRHYSNWLLIEFDYEFESGQGVTSVIEMNGSVKDNPGATKPELDFVGDIVGDSQYTGEIDGNLEESSGDILSWIKNGFGIGGDSGVIAMISDTFDFIPPEMWAVMMSGIALMVGVAVFKFIRG